MNKDKKKKVVLGLSGGVDSSVSAFLLKEQGYEITAIFMQNWDDYLNSPESKQNSCTQNKDWEDSKQVCKFLEIPLFKVNFTLDYWNSVFLPFLKGLRKGLTPNPDIICNKKIKFQRFWDYAEENFKPDYIATGHYAQIVEKNDSFFLSQPKDKQKDQTYFLCQIKKNVLKKTIFPLANFEKSEVRSLAEKIGLINAKKKDSVGLCFVGEKEKNFNIFLSQYLKRKEGAIKEIVIDEKGNQTQKKIGIHEGIHFYTLGQRRKLNISCNQNHYFVVGKDVKKNALYVVSEKENSNLFSNWCIMTKFNLLVSKGFFFQALDEEKLFARLRYRQSLVKVKMKRKSDFEQTKDWIIYFSEKQKSVTPGQFAVLYNEEGVCLGGGKIKETEQNNKTSFPNIITRNT